MLTTPLLSQFLADLWRGQPVRVGRPEPVAESDMQAALGELVQLEQEYRLELPGQPPVLEGETAEAAAWALVSLYLACSLAVYRDFGEDQIAKLLGKPEPDAKLAATHYGVDLTFRFLPEVLKLAKGAAADDPLVKWLHGWAGNWPLSSVGITGVEVDPSSLCQSPCLLGLYVDRILATSDESRLDDPVVREAVAAAIGDYGELSPKLAAAVGTSTP